MNKLFSVSTALLLLCAAPVLADQQAPAPASSVAAKSTAAIKNTVKVPAVTKPAKKTVHKATPDIKLCNSAMCTPSCRAGC